MNSLKARGANIVPDWSKPALGAIYRKAKFSFGRIKRGLRPPPFPENRDGKVYIHLGCGEINAPGFINVDAVPFSHIHYVQQVEDLSIFPNNYADLIYASHVLEHISYRKVFEVLGEWHRVLKEGGVLRLAVPDFDKLIKVYSAENKDVQTIIKVLMGGQGYAYNVHKSVFNEKYLEELLLLVGFREVRRWDPQKVELHSFEDWASRPIKLNGKKYSISLNLEAIL